MKKVVSLSPGDGARLRGAGGFIRAALSLAAFLSETITDGETCLLRCDRPDLLLCDLDLDLNELRLDSDELLEEL